MSREDLVDGKEFAKRLDELEEGVDYIELGKRESKKQVCVQLIQRLDVKLPVTFEGMEGNYLGDVLEDLEPEWFESKFGYDGTGTDGTFYEMFWFPVDMDAGVELIKKMYECCNKPIFVNCRFELHCYGE